MRKFERESLLKISRVGRRGKSDLISRKIRARGTSQRKRCTGKVKVKKRESIMKAGAESLLDPVAYSSTFTLPPPIGIHADMQVEFQYAAEPW